MPSRLLLSAFNLRIVVFLAVFSCPFAIRADGLHQVLRESMGVNGRQMRRAFREVTETPHRATVQILEQGEVVALGGIIDRAGGIITKASEIRSADHVALSDGRQFEFQRIGYHQEHDLALLKIDVQEDLPVVEWESHPPAIGSWLITLGVGRDPVAVGVMSAQRHDVPPEDIRGYLGVELEREELPRIHAVHPNTGASAAGLQAGDLVLELDQQQITTGQELVKTLQRYRPGDTVVVRVRRDSQERSYMVRLSHPFGELLSRISFQNQLGGALSTRRDDFAAVYQHDSVLSPEECGGPVVNLDGKAVGINIARAGRTESFILPADLVTAAVHDMQAKAELKNPIAPSVARSPQKSTEEERNPPTQQEASDRE
jgi:serine protease Do